MGRGLEWLWQWNIMGKWTVFLEDPLCISKYRLAIVVFFSNHRWPGLYGIRGWELLFVLENKYVLFRSSIRICTVDVWLKVHEIWRIFVTIELQSNVVPLWVIQVSPNLYTSSRVGVSKLLYMNFLSRIGFMEKLHYNVLDPLRSWRTKSILRDFTGWILEHFNLWILENIFLMILKHEAQSSPQ